MAREAAALLYTSQEKEYKQAKNRAAKTLGVQILPSNLEVAEEIDKIASETEGSSRKGLLLQMRKDALQIMKVLRDFHPILIGSVWRGTANRKSDIDIAVFSQNPETVLLQLQKKGFKAESCSVTKGSKAESSFHIYSILPSGNEAEIVVRIPNKQDVLNRCEIYGDIVTGLNYSQLQRVLEENPLKRFLPKSLLDRYKLFI